MADHVDHTFTELLDTGEVMDLDMDLDMGEELSLLEAEEDLVEAGSEEDIIIMEEVALEEVATTEEATTEEAIIDKHQFRKLSPNSILKNSVFRLFECALI